MQDEEQIYLSVESMAKYQFVICFVFRSQMSRT